jgi:hypothetical protein
MSRRKREVTETATTNDAAPMDEELLPEGVELIEVAPDRWQVRRVFQFMGVIVQGPDGLQAYSLAGRSRGTFQSWYGAFGALGIEVEEPHDASA